MPDAADMKEEKKGGGRQGGREEKKEGRKEKAPGHDGHNVIMITGYPWLA